MTGLRATLALSLALVVAPTGGAAPTDPASWPQWGGPARNFVVDARPLATTWPSGGPRVRWRKPIGDGFSSIITDGRALYTLYREGTADVVVALDAASGETVWQARYEAPFNETCSQRLGPVPRAAPLLSTSSRDRTPGSDPTQSVVTVSAGGLMNSFDRASGRLQWSVNLLSNAADAVRACGYSSSPLAFEDLIITTAGGHGRGVMAIKAATGEVAWQSQDFANGYSSPLLIDLDGQPEVVVFTYGEVSGLNPRTGALEWTHSHTADQGVNVATPLWGADNLLFVSSAYNGGSRVLKLGRQSGKVSVQELWANRRVRIHFGNAVRIGDRIYASNGDFGAAPFAAVDVKTGDIVWRDRSVVRATLVAAGDTLVILDEDGTLALATPTATGLTVRAKAAVLSGRSWTVPTLSGTTLYLRNATEVVALDLSRSATP
jgi:outer membrane protein assembly factor BamB